MVDPRSAVADLDPGEDPDPAGLFKARLRRFQGECGNPSIRDLVSLFGKLDAPQSKSAIQAKLTGKTIPDWPFVETFVRACVRHAGTGVEPDLRRWRERHTRMRAELAVQGKPLPPVGPVCPYRGLEAFTEQDTMWFHGRGSAVDQVLAAVDTHRQAVLLLGPSGAGKSSLVQAGVLPAVADGRLPGSDLWLQVCVRPGQDLPADLDRGGLPGAGVSLQAALHDRLAGHPAGCRLLLVIDQFEELLTPGPDPEPERVRRDMLTQLATVIGTTGVTLVLIMRDDFYPQLASQAHDLLAAVTPVNLPATLTMEQLQDIITKPATTAGLSWDTGLAEQIVTDVLADFDTGLSRCAPVTVLPLLELTLHQLWQRRDATRLTHDAYRRVGGVRGAVTTWCDAAMDQFSDLEQNCAERVLTTLVRPADTARNVPAMRQQVRMDTLRELGAPIGLDVVDPSPGLLVDRVLHTLTRHRILTTRTLSAAGGPDAAGVPVAELVHDAVIRDWAVLRAWVDRDHRFQDWLRRTDERHRQWVEHPTGSDLAEGIDWSTNRPLPAPITVFLHASHQHQQARIRRTRRVSTVLAGLLAVVLVVAVVAVWQRRTAVAAQQIALSRQLAAQSTALLTSDPDLARLLAIHAYRTSPTAEATDSLYAADSQPVSRHLTGHTDRVFAVAFAQDGKSLASGGHDGTVQVLDLASGKSQVLGHTGGVYAVAFTQDGKSVVSAGADGTVQVWDLASGKSQVLGHTGGVYAVAFAQDGKSVASGGWDGTVQVWDLASGKSQVLGRTGPVLAMAFAQDGKSLASAGEDGTVRVWDLPSGQSQVLTGHTGPVLAVAFTQDGKSVASGGDDGTVRVWDLPSGQSQVLTQCRLA